MLVIARDPKELRRRLNAQYVDAIGIRRVTTHMDMVATAVLMKVAMVTVFIIV
jgi:hypothetical protein